MTKDLLLDFLIILFPILFYQLIQERLWLKGSRMHDAVIGLLGGASIVLCMEFPVEIVTGYLWDLRSVPLILAVLYGGWLGGGIATSVLVIDRLLIGGDGMWFALGIVLLAAPVVFFASRGSLQRSPRCRILISAGLVTYWYGIALIGLQLYMTTRDKPSLLADGHASFLAMMYVQNLCAMLLASYLVEKVIELSNMRENMQRAEKLSIISELAASVAHEVRNPLTVVRGFLQLMQGSLDNKSSRYMKTAISELDRAEFIISDYLNFAKPQLDRVETLELAGHLHSVISIMNSYAVMKNVELHTEWEDGLVIRGDGIKCKQAVMNLIKNSIEAMPQGGQITVRAWREGREAWIEVQDTGEGMTPLEVQRLGTPFYSTKDKGTGLGLMVTFRIIEAMQGQITFRSEKGKGTTAIVQLPLSGKAIGSSS